METVDGTAQYRAALLVRVKWRTILAHAVMQSLAAQTMRLVSDVTAPVAAGSKRLSARLWRSARAGGSLRERMARVSVRQAAMGTGAAVLIVTAGLAGAAAWQMFGDAPPSASAPGNAVGEALQAGPVKIVDASPRGASCEEQVWPYIEQRCLRRAAAPPPVASLATPPAPAAPPVAASSPPTTAAPPAPIAAEPPPTAQSEAPAPIVAEAPAEPEPLQARDGGQGAEQAVMLAGAVAGAAAIHVANPDRRAERRRSVRRHARRSGFRLPILGLRF